MEAVILVGIQAAGKSSFYRTRFFAPHVRINMDMLRTRYRERILLSACLAAKQPFVVDNTNPSVSERAIYVKSARASGFRVVGYFFRTTLEEALSRNRERTGAARIPDKGIFGTHKRLQPPSFAEGFDTLYSVTLVEGGFVIEPYRE